MTGWEHEVRTQSGSLHAGYPGSGKVVLPEQADFAKPSTAADRGRTFYPERLNFWKHCGVKGARRAAAPEATVTSPT